MFRRLRTPCVCFLGLALLPLALTGCVSKQGTRFHLAAVDLDDPNPDLKFYRVTIKAKCSNVKSELQTGFYDANAVRQLYGNISTNPAPAGEGKRVGMHQFLFDPKTKQWRPVPDDQLFTIIYGVSAKAIAATIRMYNESDETGKQFASVLAAAAGRDSYIESIKAEDVQTEQRKKLSALLDKMKGFNDSANKLDASSAKPNDASAVVVQAMQETARQLGSSVTLDPSDLKASLQRAQELLDDLQAADKGK